MQDETVGSLIGGKYEIRSLLGAGGLGSVYHCYDHSTRQEVALKRLKTDINIPQFVIDQTNREATILSGLHHPNIVRVIDFGIDQVGIFFVLELIHGPSLASVFEQGPMHPEIFFKLAAQCLEGLGAAHRKGLLHLDIKPANLMLANYPDENFQVKILDFGVAKLADEAAEGDDEGFAVGSIYYISPEQLSHTPQDARTDLYSMGHVFYHALSGYTAYSGENTADVVRAHLTGDAARLNQIAPHIHPSLADWVHHLIALDPEHRPHSAQAALQGLMTAIMHYNNWQAELAEAERKRLEPQPVEEVKESARKITQGVTGVIKRILGG